MRDFFALLKATYEEMQGVTEDWWYVDNEREIKIPCRDVKQIVEGYYSAREELDSLYETLDEKEDYIRLLRKENKELKELQNEK